ncbi:MAG: hypothetical protein JNN30_07765 [Rhodanobacteraceae bacterium]|nr:hypothetical protein [Rhodanobacteraceae bacterium]
MKETRSASQIQYGYLPEQTVDVQGGIWKVRRWNEPPAEHAVDVDALRAELVRAVAPWRSNNLDDGFADAVAGGAHIQLRKLNREMGISLERFPEVWMCRQCKRLQFKSDGSCPCGSRSPRSQLPFVGFHSCGRVRAPSIPKCPKHRDIAIRYPGTASAQDIVFFCPVCQDSIRAGLGFVACECGDGNYEFTVHRAASVYTPRNVVLVNPPSTHRIRELTAAGGAARALEWVLGGMVEGSATEVGATAESLRQQLLASGLPESIVEDMVLRASGHLRGPPEPLPLDGAHAAIAEQQAVTMALAASNSRTTLEHLQRSVEPTSAAGIRYGRSYADGLAMTGLAAVELYDRFPVMVGQYAYSRGNPAPGATKLRPFRDKNHAYTIYGEVAETEALLFLLSPERVCEWMRRRGHSVPPDQGNDRQRRLALLQSCAFPSHTSAGNEAGEDLVTLVHSLCHRTIRLLAVHAGIDRNGLSELLVPAHLGFYIYAPARGDFVLGGLQAVFESELDSLLRALALDEHRCALDPGCERNGAACTACLHIGEPSCRLFNRSLSRTALFGQLGYYC